MNAFRRSIVVILVAVAAVIAGTELRHFVDSQGAPGASPSSLPTPSEIAIPSP